MWFPVLYALGNMAGSNLNFLFSYFQNSFYFKMVLHKAVLHKFPNSKKALRTKRTCQNNLCFINFRIISHAYSLDLSEILHF